MLIIKWPISLFPIKSFLHRIEIADDYEISQIIQAVIRRYSRVFPDWEVMFLSLPRDPALRAEQIEAIIAMLRNEPTA